jgi:1-phosphatidylinositol-4-phosphate 5-kinase
MSKEEVERQQRARETGEVSQEFSRSSQGHRRSSVERTMQAAEKQVHPEPKEPHSRTFGTTWDTSDAYSPSGPSTLPIVEEAGEASSSKKSPRRREMSPDHQFSEKS